MLLKPDEQILRDLDSLRSDARFIRFGEWLEASLGDCHDQSRVLDGNDLHKCIGQDILLHDLLGYVRSSRDHLDRIARTKPEGPAAR
jgi:hypothetical protein